MRSKDCLKEASCDRAVLQALRHVVDHLEDERGVGPIGAHAEKVGAGIDDLQRRLRLLELVRDRAHAKIVGDDDALEAQFLAQDVIEDDPRHGGGRAGIDRRHDDMRGHEQSASRHR